MRHDDLAALALQALKDSHRDAKWLADAALDFAMSRALSDGYSAAMEFADKAILVRDSIAQRIAVLEPAVGQAVATQVQADRDSSAAAVH